MKGMSGLTAMTIIPMLCFAPLPVVAADFPAKPVTIVVTVAPGGSNDIQSRAFGAVAERLWKQPVIRDAKAKPGHYAYASGGLHRIAHINTELFIKATGLRFRHVPYSGGGPALTALVGGHEDFASVTVSSSIPLVKGNRIRILAVQGDTRVKSIPNVPTLKELGIDASLPMVVGLWAPKKTPVPIVEKLRAVVRQVSEDKSFVNVIHSQGDEVNFLDGEAFGKALDVGSRKVAKLFKELIEEKK